MYNFTVCEEPVMHRVCDDTIFISIRDLGFIDVTLKLLKYLQTEEIKDGILERES